MGLGWAEKSNWDKVRPDYAAAIVGRLQCEKTREALFDGAACRVAKQPTLFEEVG